MTYVSPTTARVLAGAGDTALERQLGFSGAVRERAPEYPACFGLLMREPLASPYTISPPASYSSAIIQVASVDTWLEWN